MRRLPLHRRAPAHGGQALVEFALTVVVLLLTVTTLVDVGRLTVSYVDLVHAVREGGRAAALPPPATTSTGDVCAAVTRAARVVDIPCASIEIDAGGAFADRTTGGRISVTGTYRFVPIVSTVFGRSSAITLNHTAVYMVE
jgi:Flp pilus assembly protein TadG